MLFTPLKFAQTASPLDVMDLTAMKNPGNSGFFRNGGSVGLQLHEIQAQRLMGLQAWG
jgi:hypothetical protein